MEINYKEAAEYIIWLSYNSNQKYDITAKKLQEIMYLCQGWSYVQTNKPLFKEDIFTAKEFGPGINEIDSWLHRYHNRVLPKKIGNKYDNNLIESFWKIFSMYSDFTLETVCKDKIWKSHFGTPFHKENTIIPNSEIRDYFLTKYTNKPIGEYYE